VMRVAGDILSDGELALHLLCSLAYERPI